MHQDTRTYVDAALVLNETEARLRTARRALVDGQWWPSPERRRLHAEIVERTRSAEDLASELAREPEASRVVDDLVGDAWAEVLRLGAPEDPEDRVDAVLALLAIPGRAPLPASCEIGLADLPQLGPRLTPEVVRTLLALERAEHTA